MFEFFVRGGVPWMTILTLILLAAWKAPAWVKEIGKIALVVGVLAFLIGFIIAADDIAKAGDIPQGVLFGGFSVGLIAPTYGFFIYLASLIIRIIQKPKI